MKERPMSEEEKKATRSHKGLMEILRKHDEPLSATEARRAKQRKELIEFRILHLLTGRR